MEWFDQSFIYKVYLFGFTGSFAAQTFLQLKFGKGSSWGFNRGWQNEIAIWNVFAILVLSAILYNRFESVLFVSALVLMSLGFGVNHIIAYRKSRMASNLQGFVANLCGLLVILVWTTLGK